MSHTDPPDPIARLNRLDALRQAIDPLVRDYLDARARFGLRRDTLLRVTYATPDELAAALGRWADDPGTDDLSGLLRDLPRAVGDGDPLWWYVFTLVHAAAEPGRPNLAAEVARVWGCGPVRAAVLAKVGPLAFQVPGILTGMWVASVRPGYADRLRGAVAAAGLSCEAASRAIAGGDLELPEPAADIVADWLGYLLRGLNFQRDVGPADENPPSERPADTSKAQPEDAAQEPTPAADWVEEHFRCTRHRTLLRALLPGGRVTAAALAMAVYGGTKGKKAAIKTMVDRVKKGLGKAAPVMGRLLTIGQEDGGYRLKEVTVPADRTRPYPRTVPDRT